MSALRPWLWPLVRLYAVGLAVKDGVRAAGILPVKKLAWPVVSVGSISAGGAGKTPVVIALARLLQKNGCGVDVLSRGYGRLGVGIERVNADADGAATRFGDEPVMIAQRTGATVWVGASRFAAGIVAEAAGTPGIARHAVHLLDDGFQHRQLARAIDIAVVTEQDLHDAMLPAGNRREPLRALQRADAIVLREEEQAAVEKQVRRWMRPDAALWVIRRRVHFTAMDADAHAPAPQISRPLAFCGIARPADFWTTIARSGYETVGTMSFGDHHAYTMADVEQLVNVAETKSANGFVTTEKDAVKLTPAMHTRLASIGPVFVAQMEATFADEPAVMSDLVQHMEARLG